MKKCLCIKNLDQVLIMAVDGETEELSLLWEEVEPNLYRLCRETEEALKEKPTREMIRKLPESHGRPEYIFIKERDYFRRIDFCKILWIEAAGSYCSLHLHGEPKLMLSFNLSELSPRLSESLFLRVHRSYIVNLNYIDSFVGNTLCIGKDRIPISKQYKAAVINRLNVLGSTK